MILFTFFSRQAMQTREMKARKIEQRRANVWWQEVEKARGNKQMKKRKDGIAKRMNGKVAKSGHMTKIQSERTSHRDCEMCKTTREKDGNSVVFFFCSNFEKLGSCYCCCWAVLLANICTHIMHLFVPRTVSKTSKKRFICAFMLLNYIFPRRFAYFALLFFLCRCHCHRRRHRRSYFSL